MQVVEFELKLEDLAKFNLYVAGQSKIQKRIEFGIKGVFGIVLVGIIYFITQGKPLYFLLFGVPGILYYIAEVSKSDQTLETKLMKKFLKNKYGPGTLCLHQLMIDEAGVFESTEVNNSFTTWDGVRKIERNEEYLFIFINSIQAHVIPISAFISKDMADSFYNQAVDYLLSSRRKQING